MTENHYSNGPVTDISSNAMRCYQLAGGAQASTYTVAAGSTVGFTVGGGSISHQGTLQFYMAQVPAGQDAASFDGSGTSWFKLSTLGPVASSSGYTFPSLGMSRSLAVIATTTTPVSNNNGQA